MGTEFKVAAVLAWDCRQGATARDQQACSSWLKSGGTRRPTSEGAILAPESAPSRT